MDINSSGLITSLAFFSPIIITTSILIFSLFIGSLGKGLFFIFWILIVTGFRIFILWLLKSNSLTSFDNSICNLGSFLPYDNATYSLFILCFTFFYITVPMYINQNVNYGVLLFFISYIIFDILIKMKNKCISSGKILFGEIVSGLGLGALISSLLFGSPLRSSLFVNDVSSNKEVCNMPSKQQFKCAVYKNGELIGAANS